MSARTPFFPNGANTRPPTRNSMAKPPTTSSDAQANLNFQADLSNPLHALSGPATAATGNSGDISEPTTRLNTSGLGALRKKRGSLAAPGLVGGPEGQIGDASKIPRSSTADPHAKIASGAPNLHPPPQPSRPAQAASNGNSNARQAGSNLSFGGGKPGFARRENANPIKLMAPVPLPAASPLLTNANFSSPGAFSGFKPPALLGQGHVNRERLHDDAHIVDEKGLGGGLDDGHDQLMPNIQQGFNRSFNHPSDTSSETLAEQDDDSFDISRSKESHKFFSGVDAGGSGPRRISLDAHGRGAGGNDAQSRYVQQGQGNAISVEQGRGGFHQPGAGTGRMPSGRKRPRELAGDIDQDGMNTYEVPDARRLKTGKTTVSDRMMSREQEDSYIAPQHQMQSDGRGGSAPEGQEPFADELIPASPEETAAPRTQLDLLLNMETDEFIRRHMDLYEQEVKRWNGCTMEEWLAGPEELAAAFSELLDSVKDRMLNRLRFYASLETKLDEYGEILDVRKQSLDAARERALGDSRNVLM